jgi:hypothetical protein
MHLPIEPTADREGGRKGEAGGGGGDELGYRLVDTWLSQEGEGGGGEATRARRGKRDGRREGKKSSATARLHHPRRIEKDGGRGMQAEERRYTMQPNVTHRPRTSW